MHRYKKVNIGSLTTSSTYTLICRFLPSYASLRKNRKNYSSHRSPIYIYKHQSYEKCVIYIYNYIQISNNLLQVICVKSLFIKILIYRQRWIIVLNVPK